MLPLHPDEGNLTRLQNHRLNINLEQITNYLKYSINYK